MKRTTIATIAGLLLAAAAALPAPAAEELRITYAAPNAIYWDTDIALEKGYFKAEGFEPKIIPLQSSVSSTQQLLSGDTHLSGGSPEPIIQAYMRGASDVALLTAGCNKVDWFFVVTPDIKTMADLKGKKIGVSAMRGGESTLVRQMLDRAGLKYGTDYTFIQVGISPLKYAAMIKGSIAGAALFQPSGYLALSKGMKELVDMSELAAYPFPIFAVSRKWAAAGDRAARVIRALHKAQTFLHDPANRKEATAILAKYTKAAPGLAEKTVAYYLDKAKLYNTDTKLDRAGLARLVDIMIEQQLLAKKPTKVEELMFTAAQLK